MLPYAITIFLSAFLLFQVQLFLAKYILPWFGGVPSVWTTCMLFFQVLLLGGYGYAHWLTHHNSLRAQRTIHIALVAVSIVILGALAMAWGVPLLPDTSFKPASTDAPVLHILMLLVVSVGLPFFVLSATNPLLQSWFSQTHPGVSPYRLYSLSNIGSMIGLVGYPFAIEVWIPLHTQAWVWSGAFVVFSACMAAIAWRASGRLTARPGLTRGPSSAGGRPSRARYLIWFGLSACASTLLLATTNQMTQEIAVIPFLWMLPLTLYLLTFILCFDSDRWYSRRLLLPAFVMSLAMITLQLDHGLKTHLYGQIAIYSIALFVFAMVCHGELARQKPDPRHLTGYYLAISFGGALGGVFVGILAPLAFAGFWELPLGLVACAALIGVVLWNDRTSFWHRQSVVPALATLGAMTTVAGFVFWDKLAGAESPSALVASFQRGPLTLLATAGGLLLAASTALVLSGRLTFAATAARLLGGTSAGSGRLVRLRNPAMIAALLVLAAVHLAIATEPVANAVHVSRNFYGLLAVVESHADDADERALALRHGRITHGFQWQAAHRRLHPNSYYGPNSGIALAFRHHPRRLRGSALRVAVIGLGTGTLAAYGKRGDDFRFYEINPDVVRLAHGADATFTYLNDTPAAVTVRMGDARLVLEQESVAGEPGDFDVLAIDAFSSDSIPVHLLTREAFETYLDRLDDYGVLAIHISNRYVALRPVVSRLASEFGLRMVNIDSAGREAPGEYSSDWALLSRHEWIETTPALSAASSGAAAEWKASLWTDDYSNVFEAVRFRADRDTSDATE